MGQFDEKFTSGKSVYLWLHINAVKDEYNQIINYIGFARDLTDQKRQEQHLSYLKTMIVWLTFLTAFTIIINYINILLIHLIVLKFGFNTY